MARNIDVLHIVPFYNPDFSYLENKLPVAQAMHGQHVVVFAGMSMFPDHSRETYRKPVEQVTFTRSGSLSIYPCKSWFIKKHPGLNLCNANGSLKYKPKVVYIHGITSLNIIYGVFFKLYCGALVLVDCHNDFSNESAYASSRLFRFLATLYGLAIKTLLKTTIIKKVISIGKGSTNYCTKRLGLSLTDIKEIGLGYDSDIFSYSPRLATKRAPNPANRSFHVGVIGKFSREKNLDAVADFIDILKSRNYHVAITLAGAFLDQDSRAQAEMLKNLAHDYKFLGVIDAKKRKAFFDEMDLCVWAGRPSILIQECIACGCPALVSDHQSTLKFAFDDYLFSEKGDNRVFFHKLKEVSSLKELLKSIQASQRRAIVGCSWNEIAHDLKISFE